MGKYFVYRENGKVGIRDISQKIIISPKYDVIYGENKPIIQVGIGEENHRKWGLIDIKGNIILPVEYDRLIEEDGRYIVRKDGVSYAFEFVKKHK